MNVTDFLDVIRVVWQIVTDASKESVASVFRVKKFFFVEFDAAHIPENLAMPEDTTRHHIPADSKCRSQGACVRVVRSLMLCCYCW
jgi:hypothetical protein